MKFFAEGGDFSAQFFDCSDLGGDKMNDGVCPLGDCLVFLCRLGSLHSFFDWDIVATGRVLLWVLGIVCNIFHEQVNGMPSKVFGVEDIAEGFIEFADGGLRRLFHSIVKDSGD